MIDTTWKNLSIDMGEFCDKILLIGDGEMQLYSNKGKRLEISGQLKEAIGDQNEFWWKPGKIH